MFPALNPRYIRMAPVARLPSPPRALVQRLKQTGNSSQTRVYPEHMLDTLTEMN